MTIVELEECINLYGKDIYGFCRRMSGSLQEGEDLYQDTFLKAMELSAHIDENGNPKSYLLSIAIRLWKNKRRKYALRQTLAPEILDEKSNRNLMKKMEEKGMIKKHFAMKKAVILAAAACLMIGTVSVASSGAVSYIVSHGKPTGYTKFTQLDEAEHKAGYNVKAVQNFRNGYHFKEMSVFETNDVDENDNVVAGYNQLGFVYEKEGADTIHIDTMQAMHAHENEEREADKVSETKVSYVVWTQNDIRYRIMSFNEVAPEELFTMAEELITLP